MNCIQAYDCKKWRADGRKSLSHCRHFWLRASTLIARLFSGTFPPLLEKCLLASHGSAVEIRQMLFWLLKSFFPFDFSVRLLRTSTSPVMHSLLPSGTTKRDSLEEEGRRGFAWFAVYFTSDQMYETAASMLLHNNRERHSLTVNE